MFQIQVNGSSVEKIQKDFQKHIRDLTKFFSKKNEYSIRYNCLSENLENLKSPTLILFRGDGTKQSESWYLSGQRHRKGNPTITAYYSDGKVCGKHWYENGINVKSIFFSESGTTTKKEFSNKDQTKKKIINFNDLGKPERVINLKYDEGQFTPKCHKIGFFQKLFLFVTNKLTIRECIA